MREAGAQLEERAVVPGSKEYDAFIELYESAFFPEERIDPEHLLKGVQLSACSLTAYYDGDDFCGFTYEISLECALYLLLLAVDGNVRSRGYGSRILTHVKNHASGRPVVLDIKPVSGDAPDVELRMRRLRFYERNGYSDTGYQLVESGVLYTVLATDGFTDLQTLKNDFARLALGFAEFEIVCI